MKPEILISAAAALALLLTGCGTGGDTGESTSTSTASQSKTAEISESSESVTAEPVITTTEETSETTEETTVTTTEEQTATTAQTQSTEETERPIDPPAATYSRSFYDNDLFIGDSISTGLFLYGFLDKSNVFAEVGLNPESALTKAIDGVTCTEKAAAMQPRNIYIMLGTNGLAYMNGSYMANKMGELTEKLKSACPDTNIYIITIPPVTAAHEAQGNETMALVNGYNSKLKELCAQNGCGCIDLCRILQNDSGYFSSTYAEQDGLHFLGTAYIAMLNFVQKCAEGF